MSEISEIIESILLVDDETLFHLIFDDTISLIDLSLSLKTLKSADEAEEMFKKWFKEGRIQDKPECVFVDLNLQGSTFDGIELIRKINYEYGNSVVIGIISGVDDPSEQTRALQSGAQFWILKTNDLEPILTEFKKDYPNYKKRTIPFKVYR